LAGGAHYDVSAGESHYFQSGTAIDRSRHLAVTQAAKPGSMPKCSNCFRLNCAMVERLETALERPDVIAGATSRIPLKGANGIGAFALGESSRCGISRSRDRAPAGGGVFHAVKRSASCEFVHRRLSEPIGVGFALAAPTDGCRGPAIPYKPRATEAVENGYRNRCCNPRRRADWSLSRVRAGAARFEGRAGRYSDRPADNARALSEKRSTTSRSSVVSGQDLPTGYGHSINAFHAGSH